LLTSANVNFRCTALEATGIPNPRAQRWVQPFLSWEFPLQGAQSTQVVGTNVVGMVAQNTWWTLADITSPLPVDLLYFKAACNDKEVLLRWSTASEKNCKSFTIEKSTNGTDFEILTLVKGSGNSTSALSYSFEDRTSMGRNNYYRLSQTDYNGNVSIISDLLEVRNCSESDIFSVDLIDNPSEPSLLVNSPAQDNMQLTIFNIEGKLIHSEKIALEKGLSKIKLKTDHLDAAVYLVRIECNDQVLNKRILIAK
jgi:hypothetical protein